MIGISRQSNYSRIRTHDNPSTYCSEGQLIQEEKIAWVSTKAKNIVSVISVSQSIHDSVIMYKNKVILTRVRWQEVKSKGNTWLV